MEKPLTVQFMHEIDVTSLEFEAEALRIKFAVIVPQPRSLNEQEGQSCM